MIRARMWLFLGGVFLTAWAAGFGLGRAVDPMETLARASLDPVSRPAVGVSQNRQFNVLLVAVDDKHKTDAVLQGVWLAAYSWKTRKLILVPVFPAAGAAPVSEDLAAVFSLAGGKPARDFWRAMKATGLWWDGYLLTDAAETGAVMALLRGAEMGEAVQTEKAANPLGMQEGTLRMVCAQLGSENPFRSVATWNRLVREGQPVSPQMIVQLMSLAEQFEGDNRFRCEFPASQFGP